MEANGGICDLPTKLPGRSDQWATAMRALDDRRDDLTIMLIEGALGSGKTRFLQEVTTAAAQRGFKFVPQAGRSNPVSAKWWRDSSAFAAGIHALLKVGPVDGRTILAADDLHAAHVNLVRELCCIIRYRQDSPVMLMLTRRQSLSPVPEFERYLVSNSERVVRLWLQSLNRNEVVEAATDLLGVPPARDLMVLLGDAGGNPFLLTELLKGLCDENHVAFLGDTAMLLQPGLPQRILRLVAGIVKEFTPPAQGLLRLAATLGQAFDVCQLAELQNEAVGNLLPALDELISAGMLVPSGQQMAFQYPLVRKALAANMPAPLVVALQRQASAHQHIDNKHIDRDHMDGSHLGRYHLDPEPLSEPLSEDKFEDKLEDKFAVLTDTERAIAELAATGLTNGQIARRVNRSSHTVNFHLRHVFQKLGIKSRVELARLS